MRLRPARSSDLPLLHRLYLEATRCASHGFPPSLEEFGRAFGRHPAHLTQPALLVAEDDQCPVAFARIGFSHPPGDRWTLAKSGDGLVFGPFFAERSSEGAA